MNFELIRQDYDFQLHNVIDGNKDLVTAIKYKNPLMFMPTFLCSYGDYEVFFKNISFPFIPDIVSGYIINSTKEKKKYKCKNSLKALSIYIDDIEYKIKFNTLKAPELIKKDTLLSSLERLKSEFYFEIFSFQCEDNFDAIIFSMLFASTYSWNI